MWLYAGCVFQQTLTRVSISEKAKLRWDVHKQTCSPPHSQYQASPLHYSHFWWTTTAHHTGGMCRNSLSVMWEMNWEVLLKSVRKGPKGLVSVHMSHRPACNWVFFYLPKDRKTCPRTEGMEDSGKNFIRTGKVTRLFTREMPENET